MKRMGGISKLVAAGAVSLMAMTGVTLANPGIASAGTLGSIGASEFARWCNWKRGTNVLYNAGPMNLWDAYSWQCTLTPAIPTGMGIDVNSACTLRYGRPAYAYTTNAKWAHSWMCRR